MGGCSFLPGLPGRLIVDVLSDLIMTSSQCKVEGPSNAVAKVGADSGLSDELEGPSNACKVKVEAVTGFSEKFEGPSKVCVVALVVPSDSMLTSS